MEKLIKELPSVPVDGPNGHISSAVKDHLNNGISIHNTENGASFRETQSMLLERIASEMNRLKFYMAHAQVNISSLNLSCIFPPFHVFMYCCNYYVNYVYNFIFFFLF